MKNMKRLLCIAAALVLLLPCMPAFAAVKNYYYKYDGETYVQAYDEDSGLTSVYRDGEAGVAFRFKYSNKTGKFSSVSFLSGGVSYSLDRCGEQGELLFHGGNARVDRCDSPVAWGYLAEDLTRLLNSIGLDSVPGSNSIYGTAGSGVTASAGVTIGAESSGTGSGTVVDVPQTGSPSPVLWAWAVLGACSALLCLRKRTA